MRIHQDQFPVTDMCEALEVSLSGYYAWLKRPASGRSQANETLLYHIRRVFEENDGNYGEPRICRDLREDGWRCGKTRVAKLMRKHGLRASHKQRYRVCTTDSRHDHPIAPNGLAEMKTITHIDQVWQSDITYVPMREGWLCVAGILDAYSRRIVGWAMSERIDTALTISALTMALEHRKPGQGVLHHSDRGCQYASEDYRKRLEQKGLIASMSRKGNCYDNAKMESFWGKMKTELVHRRRYETRREAARSIFEWIEGYYNRKRRHSALGYKSPVDFEALRN